MIIQMNATVCAALDHGRGGQLKTAGRDLRRMLQEGRERGGYQAEQRFYEARQKCRFLEPMRYGEATRSASRRE